MKMSMKAQQDKAPATKPHHLSFIPRTHMTEGELTPTSCPLTSTYMHMLYICPFTYTHTCAINCNRN